MRGYCGIALDNPKKTPNIGGVLRACHIFDVSLLIIRGGGIKNLNVISDTTKGWRHLPTILTTNDDIFDLIPYKCATVAVEITENAEILPFFSHPERAMYIFGRENASLDEKILDSVDYIVKIPTLYCMNLSACCNTVLYDRLAKQMQQKA